MDRLALRAAVEELNAAYVHCIDANRLEEWPDFFTDPCLYQVLPRENADAGLPTALIYCDSRGMLKDRVLAHREANIFGPHAYRHLVGCVYVTGSDGDEVLARANYAVYRTWLDAAAYGRTELFSVGEYRDRIVMTREGARFKERTVVTDTSKIDSLLVTPI